MKILRLLAAVALLLPLLAGSVQEVRSTRGGTVHCDSVQELRQQEQIFRGNPKNRQPWYTYVERSSCQFVPAGLKVYVSRPEGLAREGIVQIRAVEGDSHWHYAYARALT